MAKPKLFIGSSVEGIKIARAIKMELEYDMDVIIWNQGIFKLSHSPLEDLTQTLNEVDFASFVFLPEDILEMRGEEKNVVRDNVVFELGMFYGKLGREKVSYVMPRGVDFHLPSDLTGVTGGTYDSNNQNVQSSVGSYCEQIRQQLESLKTSFPESGNYGINILHPSITKANVDTNFSFSVIIPRGHKLKIIREYENGCFSAFRTSIGLIFQNHEIYINENQTIDNHFQFTDKGKCQITVYDGDIEVLNKMVFVE